MASKYAGIQEHRIGVSITRHRNFGIPNVTTGADYTIDIRTTDELIVILTDDYPRTNLKGLNDIR